MKGKGGKAGTGPWHAGGATNAHEDTTARLCFGSTRTAITLRQACDVIDLDIDTVAKSTLSLQPP